ncbi:hypothetical protein [Jeongeupia sp. USM3]|uniref:hypothetical protein n=1 Tax=Jeongeupia sp. USM3 TaxID=1906741 RepID=UPI0011AB2D86|nr:hypothetical protein [Jeongeupia sp. USM3]
MVTLVWGIAGVVHAVDLPEIGDRLVLPAASAAVDDLSAQQGTAGVASTKIKETMTTANIAAQTGSVISALEHVASGANTIGAGALAGMNGIGTIIQNTGNSVMIQNSTILNVAVQ